VVFHPQNLPTYVVPRPLAASKKMKLGNVPWFLRGIYQQPVLHFWIYHEIVRGMRFQWRQLQGRNRLVPIDVCFWEQSYELIEKIYDEQGNGEDVNVLRQMGQWLTEQVTAFALSQDASAIGVIVRCIVCGEDSFKRAWLPLRWWERGFGKIERWLLGETWGSSAPFWIEFPSTNPSFTFKVIDIVQRDPIEKHLSAKTSFPGTEIDRNTFPLVSQEHVTLMPVEFPHDSGKMKLVYLRHNGFHETWLYNPGSEPEQSIGGWHMVPQEAWMPLESGNWLLLGRLAKTETGPIIVPGSMLVRVEY